MHKLVRNLYGATKYYYKLAVLAEDQAESEYAFSMIDSLIRTMDIAGYTGMARWMYSKYRDAGILTGRIIFGKDVPKRISHEYIPY